MVLVSRIRHSADDSRREYDAYVAVNLIGLWAILIGVLELDLASHSAKDRALLIIAAFASIAIGVVLMRWVFAGAVLVSAIVGIAAAARGVSLIVSGIHEQRSLPAKGIGQTRDAT